MSPFHLERQAQGGENALLSTPQIPKGFYQVTGTLSTTLHIVADVTAESICRQAATSKALGIEGERLLILELIFKQLVNEPVVRIDSDEEDDHFSPPRR